ncbi:hypothetical protein [Rubrimonas sp.]|uniref:hypothetical protein n=1 Tax=Rubrimonas sp. TaxID=2036015 RepID=UPI002FDEFD49
MRGRRPSEAAQREFDLHARVCDVGNCGPDAIYMPFPRPDALRHRTERPGPCVEGPAGALMSALGAGD